MFQWNSLCKQKHIDVVQGHRGDLLKSQVLKERKGTKQVDYSSGLFSVIYF